MSGLITARPVCSRESWLVARWSAGRLWPAGQVLSQNLALEAGMRSRTSEVFSFPRDAVRAAVVVAFRNQGWGFNPNLAVDDVLTARVGADLLSFGETIEVRLLELSNDRTQVLAESRTNWQVLDYGRTKRELRQLLSSIYRELTEKDALNPSVRRTSQELSHLATCEPSRGPFCTSCGSPSFSGNCFCTACGKPI